MLRNIYAEKALNQIPRLLSNLDRNPFSPTYGCFHRDYWLDKTSDFPDAVRQFAMHALALVYRYDFPNNIYKGNTKIKNWCIAALEFWTSIQHKDGSFDEFYPNERGWVGPSAFTTYTAIETFNLLKGEMSDESCSNSLAAIRKAAYFIINGEKEEDHLANHHAMACLATWKAYELLQEKNLKIGYDKLWQGFLTYHCEEGWSTEYDGIDPGYLSATISFLAKIYASNKSEELFKVINSSIKMCSYFVYPNRFYAGSMGSRNTLHFYPHGFEILGKKIPLANTIAMEMLRGLDEGKLVPPEIISDRYVVYRVPEFLLSYLDYSPKDKITCILPCYNKNLQQYFPLAKIWVYADANNYLICNLAKGGIIKLFNNTSKLTYNDCGILAKTNRGKIITSQWIDNNYKIQMDQTYWSISGNMHAISSMKTFSVGKFIIFRVTLLMLGWYPPIAHKIKASIRKVLALGIRPVPINFRRTLSIDNKGKWLLHDELHLKGNMTLKSMSVGGEFFVRYVPQSRYFQSQELDIDNYELSAQEISKINREKKWSRNLIIN